MAEQSTSLEERVAKLEREARGYRIGIILLLVLAVTLRYFDKKEVSERFVTDSLIIPSNFLLGPGPFAGIARSRDEKEIVLWFAQHRSFAQTRIGFEKGDQALTFYDSRDKLRIWLGVAADGSAKLRIFDPTGKEIWSTDKSAKPGAV